MNLIKINPEHYVIVDDSEIEVGDWYIDDAKQIRKSVVSDEVYWQHRSYNREYMKITHSTQPLECDKMWTPLDGKQWMCNTMLCCGKILNPKTKPISLQEVKELIGEVDVEKKAEEYADFSNDYVPLAFGDKFNTTTKRDYLAGYRQALEDNKEKKYTRDEVHGLMCKAFIQGWKKADVVEAGLEGLETDVECAWILMRYDTTPLKTQWIVDFVDGKLKLKQ